MNPQARILELAQALAFAREQGDCTAAAELAREIQELSAKIQEARAIGAAMDMMTDVEAKA